MLTAIFLAGLVFLIAGFATRQWTLALPGSICELALAWPIKSLIRLRRENILLEILPNTLRLASADARKELVFKFVERLINQV